MHGTDLALVIGAAVLPSFLVALMLGYVVRRYAPAWGLLDRPGGRKAHAATTPLGGGLAVWGGVIATYGLGGLVVVLATTQASLFDQLPDLARTHLEGIRSQLPGLALLLTAGTVLLVVGLLDDRHGLSWKVRLGTQFAIAALCVALNPQVRLTIFIEQLLPLTWLLSVLWIVGLINSFNMLDNMDAASGGIAMIASTMLAAFLLLPGGEEQDPQWFVAGFLLVLSGGLLGFLWHNRPPAKLFMGDAGSYFIGFYIAVATLLATYTGYHSAQQHAILAPLIVMAVPLYDTVTVLWIRIREGRSLVEADRCHFSHRLVDLGLSKGQAVLTIYLLTVTCGLAALLLRRVDVIGAAVIVLLILCILALINILESSARKKLQS